MHTFVRLASIVFFSGALVMIFELVGARILSPHLGASMHIWTSVIGVILGSLSIGYWWGGRLADTKASFELLAQIFLAATIGMGLVVWLYNPIITFFADVITHSGYAAIVSSFILFVPVSIALGMVSPIAIRLNIHDVEHAGSVVGNLNAISTIGSIVGTFGAGFILIPLFGSSAILTGLVVVLWILAIASFVGTNTKASRVYIGLNGLALLVLLSLLFPATKTEGSVVAHAESMYGVMRVEDDEREGRARRILWIDAGMHSGMWLDAPNELTFDYSKFYILADKIVPTVGRALMIGGGGYSYPKYFLEQHPTSTIDVIEIDPAVTELAFEHFELETSPRMNIFHQDARVFLNRATTSYDVVYGDAFLSHHGPPPQLVTKEALTHIKRVLREDGVFIVNIIGAIEGDNGKFVRAFFHTNQAVFEQVHLLRVRSLDSSVMQNYVLVAINGDDDSFLYSNDVITQSFLKLLWKGDIPNDMPLLTDDYAPVDHYMQGYVRREWLKDARK